MAEDRGFPDWEELYRGQGVETMAWYYPVLDPDLDSALERYRLSSGSAIDIGTGPGTQAIALAERGFRVTGTDLSQAAVDKATEKARAKGLTIDFRKDDILASQVTGAFDFAFDRGCFHVLPSERRADYARTVASVLKRGGFLFLKCFSHLEPGETGPHRLSPGQVREAFEGHFDIHSIEQTIYHGTRSPLPRALFCSLAKR